MPGTCGALGLQLMVTMNCREKLILFRLIGVKKLQFGGNLMGISMRFHRFCPWKCIYVDMPVLHTLQVSL